MQSLVSYPSVTQNVSSDGLGVRRAAVWNANNNVKTITLTVPVMVWNTVKSPQRRIETEVNNKVVGLCWNELLH